MVEIDQKRTMLGFRCNKITNYLLKNLDNELWEHF